MKILTSAFLLLSLLVPTAFASTSSGNLTGSSRWEWNHDKGTPGTSTGYSSFAVESPSIDKEAREMSVSYWDHGGEIYHLSFGNDESATHFVYDTYIYIADPGEIANIELDINQVLSNDRTTILGTQCSSYSGSWEFVTTSGKSPHWHPSNIPCNPKNWKANTWHHVQIYSHHNGSGDVTYDSVILDGKQEYFKNAGGYSSLALGWSRGDLLLNFQLDGASGGNGSMKVYVDKLTIDRY